MDAGLAVEISGTWTGYVESYTFSDQSDAVTLNLSVAGSTVTGQATFGMSAAPPAPTDPSVGYPPGLSLDPGGAGALSGPYPGFAFTIQNGTFSGDRLQFATSTTELWSAWCAAQTPIADEVNAGNYSCVHNWGITGGATCSQTDPMTQQIIPVDCTKYVLCQQVCACTAQACSAGSDQSVHFDLNIQLPRADGSATGLDSNVHNVHLTKG
jgi:hypothetical protein